MKKQSRFIKALIALFLSFSMILGYIPSVLALGSEETNAPKGYVTISVEKFTLGQGYIKEPVRVPFYEGDSVAKLIDRLLLGKENYEGTASYLARVRDGFDGSEETNIPQYILDEIEKYEDVEYPRKKEGFLGQLDYTFMSGWMYCVNNWFPDHSAGTYMPKDGDVIRWQFTVFGYGMDIGGGFSSSGEGSFGRSYVPIANKDELTKMVGEINGSDNKDELLSQADIKDAYENAYNVLEKVDVEQEKVDKALADLDKALNTTAEENEAPVINAKDITVEVGDIIDFLKDVTATDKEDGKVSPVYDDISDKNAVISNVAVKAGAYEVTYTAKDSKGEVGTKKVNLTVNPNSNIKIGAADKEILELKEEIVNSLKEVEEPQITLLNDGKYLYTIRMPKKPAKSYGHRSFNAQNVQDYTTIALILPEKDIKPEIKGVKDITVKTGEKIDLLKDITAKDGLEVPVEVKIQNENKLPIENGKVTKEGQYTVTYTAKRGDVETTEKVIMEVKSEPSGGGNTNPSKPDPSNPDPSKSDVKEEKLIGSTRYETAVKVSKKDWETSDNVILVNGNAIPDALAVTPFAKQKNAPILLTGVYKLNEDTRAEIERLKAKNVYVIGGDGVVSEGVLSELRAMGVNVERIAGNTRFETSLAIAKKMSNVTKIAIVNGETGLSDATSIAAVAGYENMAIILMPTKGTNIYDQFIKDNNIAKFYVIGQVGAISKEIENRLPNAERIGGANRSETNAKIIEKFYASNKVENMFICKDGSTKENELIDALSVGALAAKENSPIVIVGKTLNDCQKEILKSKLPKAMTQVGGGCEEIFEQIKKLY